MARVDPGKAGLKEKFSTPGGRQLSFEEIIADYRLSNQSRIASVIGRREVLTGKAKFGIFGDGKEIAQLAMARVFKHGDWRSGYYRDQTFMFALGISDVKKFFAQLYADPDLAHEPSSGGRQQGFADSRPYEIRALTLINSHSFGGRQRCHDLCHAAEVWRSRTAH